MNASGVWKSLLALRAAGPYLLIELILPGGTLVAFLLWLLRRFKREGFGGLRAFLSVRKPSPTILEARSGDAPAAAPLGPYSPAVR